MDIKLDRVHLSFDSVGSQDCNVNGKKPPIIFLHGVTSAKETWKNVLRPIAEATRRKAYAFDARNHGDSGKSDVFDYLVMVEDLIQFMNALHLERATIIGHSMGGKTAMFFALKWPGRVEKLIVEDISPKPSNSDVRVQVQKYVDFLDNMLCKIPPDMTDLEEAKNFVHKLLQDLVPQEQRSSRHGSTDGSSLPLTQDEDGQYKWKTDLKTISNTFFKGSLSSLHLHGTFKAPTLMLYGTKSPHKVTDDRDFILDHFPGARFRGVEGATHQIHSEYEDVFLEEAIHFINEAR